MSSLGSILLKLHTGLIWPRCLLGISFQDKG